MKIRWMVAANLMLLLVVGRFAWGDAFRDMQSDDADKIRAMLQKNPGLAVIRRKVDGEYPLHVAALGGREAVAEVLLEYHAPVDARDNYGQTPLHMAALNGHLDVVELLLKHGADPNAADHAGLTPVYEAAIHRQKDVVELLVKHGGRLNIFEACACGDVDRAKPMLKDNPRLVFATDKFGNTPLHYAAKYGQKDAAELLLNGKADVDAKDKLGQTPLFQAANKDVAEVLIANKAQVNIHDNSGQTPLLTATRLGYADVVDVLLANNADLQIKEPDSGQTPLHIAAFFGYKEIVASLLAHNAAVNAKDNQNRTPLKMAMLGQKDKAVIALLRKHGGTE